jgi:hypothetical protein
MSCLILFKFDCMFISFLQHETMIENGILVSLLCNLMYYVFDLIYLIRLFLIFRQNLCWIYVVLLILFLIFKLTN